MNVYTVTVQFRTSTPPSVGDFFDVQNDNDAFFDAQVVEVDLIERTPEPIPALLVATRIDDGAVYLVRDGDYRFGGVWGACRRFAEFDAEWLIGLFDRDRWRFHLPDATPWEFPA